MRKFAVCKKYNQDEVTLPVRSTKNSAGYDFFAVEDVEIPSIWKKAKEASTYRDTALTPIKDKETDKEIRKAVPFAKVLEKVSTMLKPTVVFTGVKAYMNEDEYLEILNRSSNPLKKFILLANGVGVIDSDYVDNPSNDGEIGFLFWNLGIFNLSIKKGEKIGQGIFHKYLITDDDTQNNETIRQGGFGSTDK